MNVIETGYPLPIERQEPSEQKRLRETILAMKVATGLEGDQSFVVSTRDAQRAAIIAAKAVNAKIRTQKQNGTGFRIWRVK